MALLYQNNFDAETTGALPTGWANSAGTWSVQASNPVSGANSLKSTTLGDGDTVLYTGVASQAYERVQFKFKVVSLTSNPHHVIVRSDSTYQNCYTFLLDSPASGELRITPYKRTAGAYAALGAASASILTGLAVGDIVNAEAIANGSALEVRLWKEGSCRPVSASHSVTDTSYTTGYFGFFLSPGVAHGFDDVKYYDNAAATAVTIEGPTSGAPNVASTSFNIAANGAITGTVVVTPSDGGGGGTFTPTSVSISSTTPGACFTYTPASSGTKTISVTNNGSLTNPANISYVVSGSTIGITDGNWIWSPYNWDTVGATRRSNCTGAYFRLGFSGTSISITTDVSALSAVAASDYPIIAVVVDNGPITTTKLVSGQTAISRTGLAAGNHTIELWFEGSSSNVTDSWTTPVNAIVIGSASLDTGGTSVSGTSKGKNLIWYGDSISKGYFANGNTTQPDGNTAYAALPFMVSAALDAEFGVIAYDSQGFEAAGSANVPSFNNAYNLYSSGRSRSFTPAPDYAVLMHGTNGAPLAANVQTAITNLRAACGNATDIFVICPLGGFNRTPITSGFSAYVTATPNDRKVHFIDLGASWETGINVYTGGTATKQSIDKLHPRKEWNGFLSAAVAGQIKDKLAPRGIAPRIMSPVTFGSNSEF